MRNTNAMTNSKQNAQKAYKKKTKAENVNEIRTENKMARVTRAAGVEGRGGLDELTNILSAIMSWH